MTDPLSLFLSESGLFKSLELCALLIGLVAILSTILNKVPAESNQVKKVKTNYSVRVVVLYLFSFCLALHRWTPLQPTERHVLTSIANAFIIQLTKIMPRA